MIGQMQGKFQMEVVPNVGHMLHEVSYTLFIYARHSPSSYYIGRPTEDRGCFDKVLEEK